MSIKSKVIIDSIIKDLEKFNSLDVDKNDKEVLIDYLKQAKNLQITFSYFNEDKEELDDCHTIDVRDGNGVFILSCGYYSDNMDTLSFHKFIIPTLKEKIYG